MRSESQSIAKLVVNPAAGGGAVGRSWPQLYRGLQKSGIPFDCEFTRAPGDAAGIARLSVWKGYRTIVAIGGDGTVNEVANGILDCGSVDTSLGVMNVGTAHAFALSMGVDREILNWNWLVNHESILIDVGVVQCRKGREVIRRFFVNEASLGLSAEMAWNWERLPKHLGRNISLALRTVSAYGSFVAHRNASVRLNLDGETESMRCACIVVANGRYVADGMRMAPHAEVDDGLFDVITFGDITKAEMLKMKPRLYSGDLVGYPRVKECRAKTAYVESEDRLVVEVDGEIIGESPALFEVLPLSLRVTVPGVESIRRLQADETDVILDSDRHRIVEKLWVDA